MKNITMIVVIATLSACGITGCGTVTYQVAPNPVVDIKSMPEVQRASYPQDVKECRSIQQKAMPVSFLEAFGSSDVRADEQRREAKAAMIVRECLKVRGYSVLY